MYIREDVEKLSLPTNLKQVKILTSILNRYTEQYYWRVVISIWTLYMFLQTFSVPGTIFLNVLCGALFGLTTGFLMTLLAGTAGASMCYVMSDSFGRPIVVQFSEKLKFLQEQVLYFDIFCSFCSSFLHRSKREETIYFILCYFYVLVPCYQIGLSI